MQNRYQAVDKYIATRKVEIRNAHDKEMKRKQGKSIIKHLLAEKLKEEITKRAIIAATQAARKKDQAPDDGKGHDGVKGEASS